MKYGMKPRMPSDEIPHLKRVIKLLYARICYLEELDPINQATMMRTAIDACAMANNDCFHMGKGRASRWEDVVTEYLNAFDKEGMEEANMRVYKGKTIVDGDEYVPATRQKIDTRLQQIYGDGFIPFDVRYHWEQNDAVFKKYESALNAFEEEMPYIKRVLEGRV